MEKTTEKKTFKQKVSEELSIWKMTFKNLKKEMSENPETAGSLIVAAGSILVGGIGLAASLLKKNDEVNRINDDFVGSYWDLDIDLTNQRLLEMNQKMIDEGISKGEALDQLGWLKNEKKRK